VVSWLHVPPPRDGSYHAGHAYAEIGKPDKALPHLRFYVQSADASADEDEAEKVLESRFVIAQMLAAAGHPDEALIELEAVRPLLADRFGADSTQVRNRDKQVSRLGVREAGRLKLEAMTSRCRALIGALPRLDTLEVGHFDPEFSRADVLDAFGDARGPVTEIWVSLLSAD
jgi:hypothetical protein